MIEYEKIRNGHRLTPTAQDLLHLMNEFCKLHKIKDIVKVHLVDNQLQKMKRIPVECFSSISTLICSCRFKTAR